MAQQYELIRVRRGGWLIPKYQRAFGRHPVGALQVTQEYLPDLHRHSLVAKLLPPVPNQGTEPIPPLYDVILLHWNCDLITLAGFERVEDEKGLKQMDCAQTWLLQPAGE